MNVDISHDIHHLSVRNQNVNERHEYQIEVSCEPTSLAVEQHILRSGVLGMPNQIKQQGISKKGTFTELSSRIFRKMLMPSPVLRKQSVQEGIVPHVVVVTFSRWVHGDP